MGQRNTAMFLNFVKENPRVPWKLTLMLPESGSSGASWKAQ